MATKQKAAPKPFYSNTKKYSDQSRVNDILGVYGQEVGRTPLGSSNFDRFYNDPHYSSDSVRTFLQGTSSGKAYAATPGYEMGNLQRFDASNPAPIDVYNKAMSEMGIPDARANVVDLRTQLMNSENLLKNVNADVTTRTQDSQVTEAQRERLVAAESAPLSTQVGNVGTALDAANSNYQTALDAASKQTDITVAGNESKRQAILDRLQVKIDNAKTKEAKREWQKEFNEKKTEFAKQQQADKAALAETIRSNKASESISASNAATNAYQATTPKMTAAEVQGQNANVTVQNLESKVGGDGHVSPATWNRALNDWLAQGYTAKSFVDRFGKYANKSYDGWRNDYAGN